MTTTPVRGPVDERAFLEQVEPLRRELTAHCYRMVGSVHEAEDMVQETYLRAWRAYHGFENRSSVRTWMYRIATNTCLTSLEGRGRRPLPTGLGQPAGDPSAELQDRGDITWLEPAPDAVLWGGPEPDPAEVAVDRDSVRLAFVAALQHLTAQQRAVLVLREVLRWSAAEVADALSLTVAGVNSTLQRARAHLKDLPDESGARTTPPLDETDPRVRELLNAYVRAFEEYDVDGIVATLTADAVWEMPPFLEWYRGNEDVGVLIRTRCPASGPGDMRLVRTGVNGNPAVAVYMRDEAGVHRPFQVQHLEGDAHGITHVTVWFGARAFTGLDLPDVLDG